MRIKFPEISVKATRRWIEDGRKRQETRKFWQTLSSFNKNAAGMPKSRDEIMAEICKERDQWLAEPHGQA